MGEWKGEDAEGERNRGVGGGVEVWEMAWGAAELRAGSGKRLEGCGGKRWRKKKNEGRREQIVLYKK